MKKLLILGIDPGDTTAYVALDTEGHVVAVDSVKQPGLNEIVSRLIALGQVCVIGTDRGHPPGFVERLAAKFGARLVSPEYDLTVEEKRKLVGEQKTRNSHEFDALASALFAYKSVSHLLGKIERYVEMHNLGSMSEKIKRLMLTTDGISISLAATLAQAEEATAGDRVAGERRLQPDMAEITGALQKISNLQQQNRFLKMENLEFRGEYETLKARMEQMGRRAMLDDNKARKLLSVREKHLRPFLDTIKSKEGEINSLKKELSRVKSFLLHSERYYGVRRVKNLGKSELSTLHLDKDDFLFVDDPAIFSEAALETVGKIRAVLCRKKPPAKVSEKVVCIEADNLEFIDMGEVALFERKTIEQILHSRDTMRKVIEQYRRERESDKGIYS